MAVLFSNHESGTTTDNPLLIGATTINSAAFADLPTVTSPDFMWLTLDPTGSAGAPEIVKVTAHTATATSCTITRAQQSTTARQHASGTSWAAALTSSDLDGLPLVCTSTTRPTGAQGKRIYETDTNRELCHDGTGWVIMSEPIQSYTPTFANTTLGNGSVAGTSHRSDGWCDFTALFTLGSTSAITGAVTVTLPYTAVGMMDGQISVVFADVSSARFIGTMIAGTTTIELKAIATSTSYAEHRDPSSTVPFTWTTSDLIEVSGRFRMNSRYS